MPDAYWFQYPTSELNNLNTITSTDVPSTANTNMETIIRPGQGMVDPSAFPQLNGPTYSVECGSPLLQFKLFDTSGTDQTSNAATLGFTINEIAPTTPAQTAGSETLWNIVVDKTKLDAIPDGTAYVFAVVVIYQKLAVLPTAWISNLAATTKTTPAVIMSPQAPLIDLSPIIAQVKAIVAIIDPILQEHFWNVTTGVLLSVFGGLPGLVLGA